jgi:hypothetical protein
MFATPVTSISGPVSLQPGIAPVHHAPSASGVASNDALTIGIDVALFAFAEERPTIHLRDVRDSNVIELNGMIEGLPAGTEVVLANKTGKSFSHLLAVSSCGCLKTREIDGKDFADEEQISVIFAYVPASERFEQTYKISGVGEDGFRQEIGSVTLRGSVIPPVRITQQAFTDAEQESGTVTVHLTHESIVKVDYSRIHLNNSTTGMEIEVDSEKSDITFAFDREKLSRSNVAHLLHVPLTWNDKSYTYTIQLALVSARLTSAKKTCSPKANAIDAFISNSFAFHMQKR